MQKYYTEYGKKIYNPEAYAKTGAPMYKYNSNININESTQIYKLNLESGKKYIGKKLPIFLIWREYYGEGHYMTLLPKSPVDIMKYI